MPSPLTTATWGLNNHPLLDLLGPEQNRKNCPHGAYILLDIKKTLDIYRAFQSVIKKNRYINQWTYLFK